MAKLYNSHGLFSNHNIISLQFTILSLLNLLQNCYAEIIPKSGSREALIYRSVGAEGRVDITAEDPGVWGQIYPYHHPVLCKSCDF